MSNPQKPAEDSPPPPPEPDPESLEDLFAPPRSLKHPLGRPKRT